MPNNIYAYPERDLNRTGMYLCFQSYEYKNANSDRLIKGKFKNSNNASYNEDLLDGTITGRTDGFLTDLGRTIETGLEKAKGKFTAKIRPTTGIYLYLPPKLEYQYSANWQKVQLGALGGGTSIGGAFGAGAATGANSVFNLLNGALTNVPKVENLSLDSLLGATLGITFNDNTVQSFDKMNPRTFGFEYIMVARNFGEQKEIENIIKTFKLAMHPNLTQKGARGLFLGYPLVWTIKPAGRNNNLLVRRSDGRIERRYDGEQGILKFLPATDFCAVTDVKVDYTPENNITMLKNGFVQAVRIALSFTELITLTREDIVRLDYSDSN